MTIKLTWSIEERFFKDYGRRIKMFKALVENIALYGAEVWGWMYDNRLWTGLKEM